MKTRLKFVIFLSAAVLLSGLAACSPASTAPTVISGEASPVPEAQYERLAAGPKQGTYYEVFVRSFADSDGDGIGDFNGLTSKLGYLSDIGITGIWLMPCFESPSYHGYDISDYYKIDPDYGTMEDFENFLTEADKLGISVILDLVINHTSTECEWFKQSRDSSSSYRSWYRWAGDAEEPNFSASFYGNKIWNTDTGGNYLGLFWSGMPDLNLENPAVRQEMKNIAKFWLDKGAAGFRLDAAMYVYTMLETGVDSTDLNIKWWTEFADYCRSVSPNCYLVGEVWDAPSVRAPYAAALDSVFHFSMGESLASSVAAGRDKDNAFANSMKMEYDRLTAVNPDAIDAIFLSNHDQTRICTALKNKPGNLKMAASVYLTMQGLPFVYYGEELGMIGGKPDENIRSPFLWGAGDSALCTWEDSIYNKKVADFAVQSTDPDSLFSHYRRLIRLRAATPALFEGVLEPVSPANDSIIAYYMTAPEQKVLVLHNLSGEPQTASIDGSGEILFSTVSDGLDANAGSITLPPQCSVVIEK